MTQLIAHLFGDFLLQSQWMADNKTKESWVAEIHAFIYALCFVPLVLGHPHPWLAWIIINQSHYLD
jgi:hypothetical protein